MGAQLSFNEAVAIAKAVLAGKSVSADAERLARFVLDEKQRQLEFAETLDKVRSSSHPPGGFPDDDDHGDGW